MGGKQFFLRKSKEKEKEKDGKNYTPKTMKNKMERKYEKGREHI